MKNNRPESRLPVRPTVRQPVAQKTIKSRFLQIAGRALPGLTIALVLLTVITFLVVDPGQGIQLFPVHTSPVWSTSPTGMLPSPMPTDYQPEISLNYYSRGGRVNLVAKALGTMEDLVASSGPKPDPVFYDAKGIPQEPIPIEKFTADAAVCYVLGDSTNIRENPQTDSPVILRVHTGDALNRTGFGQFWSEISLSDGQTGYVLSRLITEDFVARPTPTPTPKPTPTSTPKPTPTSTPKPTPTPTPKPTPTSTPKPAPTSTPKPTPTPTPKPTPTPTPKPTPMPIPTPTPPSSSFAASPLTESQKAEIVALAKSCLGIRYVPGGTTTDGFDCSGFTQYIYKTLFDITIPRQTYGQVKAGIAVPRSEIDIGDIICLDWKGPDGICDHVALYVGDGMYIDASSSAEVVRIREFKASHPVISIRRIIY